MTIPEYITGIILARRKQIFRLAQRLIGRAPEAYSPNAYCAWTSNHPVTLVAHMDTVPENRGLRPDPILDRSEPNRPRLKSLKTGLGADDRAGVALILSVLQYCKDQDITPPGVIFTDGEESGATGSRQMVRDYEGWPASMLLQLDRRGKNDVVYYDLDTEAPESQPLRDLMEVTGGCDIAIGSFSDISVLAPAWDIGAANMSVGYYCEHTLAETLVIPEWQAAYTRLMAILSWAWDNNMALVPYTETARYKWYGWGNGKLGNDKWWGDWDKEETACAAPKRQASLLDRINKVLEQERRKA